jgi:hypothetical protein
MGCGLTLKKIYIRQSAGLGDILYLQKVASHLLDSGHEIIWPVIEQYEYIKDYIQNPNLSFVSLTSLSDFEKDLYKSDILIKKDSFMYIPIDILCHAMGNCSKVMESKYDFFEINHKDWQDFVSPIRNIEREEKLRNFLSLDKDEPFVFVNKIFASPPNLIEVDYKVNTEYRVIENKKEYINLFRSFDFSWILENAKEIHTIDTSFCYLVEYLHTTDKLYMYPRMMGKNNPQYSSYNYISGVYRKKWNFMEI